MADGKLFMGQEGRPFMLQIEDPTDAVTKSTWKD